MVRRANNDPDRIYAMKSLFMRLLPTSNEFQKTNYYERLGFDLIIFHPRLRVIEMQRRKPQSAKQKKANLQLKRAVKRGDVPAPEPQKPNHRRKPHPTRRGPDGQLLGSAGNVAVIEASRKLQSAFIKLPPKFLEETKSLASTLVLPRPIPTSAAIFDNETITRSQGFEAQQELSCPRRPKWRFDMSKKDVEKNEEGVFKKWITEMDILVQDWLKDQTPEEPEANDDNEKPPTKPDPITMPPSPTYFERNLEVWRQLWRVTEISQIIFVLVDSRCPMLHYPPSLAKYLSDRQVILVLTKVDISGPARADAWTAYLKAQYPGIRVVQVESYTEKEKVNIGGAQQGRTMYQPHLPETFRSRLIEALQEVHAEMLDPPAKIKENEARLKHWKPSVKTVIDWDRVVKAGGGAVGSAVGGAAVPRPVEDDGLEPDEKETSYTEPQFLTIGLIGQPNVGKSSLLNALFNTHKVRASKTPGKTKHFQTLFWTPDIRLVDCPGLVMPNYVPMEMQVLSGILPISRVSAVPSCIHYAASLAPLEHIYNLPHPALSEPQEEDKRTWRDGMRPAVDESRATKWTAMDFLTAYATKKGWLTAKAGRPDIHRAGNAVLRQLAEGKIGWAFWPAGTDVKEIVDVVEGAEGTGIWAPHIPVVDEESEEELEESEDEEKETGKAAVHVEDISDGSDGDEVVPRSSGGRFGTLLVEEDAEEEEEESSSEEG